MTVLGLSFFYHDSAAALIRDGVPVAMAEEERFTRKKHDSGFPAEAISFVLREAGIAAADLDAVVFYEKPFVKFERIIKTALRTFPRAPRVFTESIRHVFQDTLWIRDLIAREVGVPPGVVFFSDHHLSHAASAFYPSPFERAAIVTVDGVGEWATASIAVGEGNRIRTIKEIHFPDSLGLLYSAFTAFLGFEVNEGEYKVMGMAPYGTPRYADLVRNLLTMHPDGSFALKPQYFSFDRSLKDTYSRAFVDLLGAPRDRASKFFTRDTGWPSYFGPKPEGAAFHALATVQERYADLAASIQTVLEEALVKLVGEAHREVGGEALCMAGGVALNSVANWKLVNQTPFRRLFIQPAAGDAGGALGAALALCHNGEGMPRRWRMEHASYGAAYGMDAVRAAVGAAGLRHEVVRDEALLLDRVSSMLAEGNVIGWFHGRFEWGPRALGHRSIIADPRRAEMKDIVNTKIKFREPYRPFAPSVLAERAEEMFDMPDAAAHEPGRYMLYVVPVRPEKRAIVPAITHVDGTARPELVFKETNPRYHGLISRFAEKTGVPLVLNTSFNLKGEPIVNTPADAISTFLRSDLSALVLEDAIVYR